MKKIISQSTLLVLLILLFSCSQDEIQTNEETLTPKSTAELIYDQIIKNDFFSISYEEQPIVNAEEVYDHMNEYLIIDVRTALDYSKGHIPGSVNIKLSELVDFAQVNGFPEYEKAVLVCYTGQSASYGASVLKMLGHKNVYTMEWGMTSWNSKLRSKWEKNTGDKFENRMGKNPSGKKEQTELPLISTEKEKVPGLLYVRAKQLLKDGFKTGSVALERAMPNLNKSFEICIIPEKIYKKQHIKGAVLYTLKDLSDPEQLKTLPTDKVIVVYTLNGHLSSYVAAYLRVLGYDAKTLKYGANSFMHSMVNELTNKGFNNASLHNYPLETSEYIEDEGGVQEGGC